MWQEEFEVFHGAIVDAVDRDRAKSKASRPNDQDPPHSGAEKADPKKTTHQGKLILDATVAEQAIRYPTTTPSTHQIAGFERIGR